MNIYGRSELYVYVLWKYFSFVKTHTLYSHKMCLHRREHDTVRNGNTTTIISTIPNNKNITNKICSWKLCSVYIDCGHVIAKCLFSYPEIEIYCFLPKVSDHQMDTAQLRLRLKQSFTFIFLYCSTVQILCIGTDRSQQTVQTKIRLLLKKQSDQDLRCLPFHQHLLDALMQCYIKLF